MFCLQYDDRNYWWRRYIISTFAVALDLNYAASDLFHALLHKYHGAGNSRSTTSKSFPSCHSSIVLWLKLISLTWPTFAAGPLLPVQKNALNFLYPTHQRHLVAGHLQVCIQGPSQKYNITLIPANKIKEAALWSNRWCCLEITVNSRQPFHNFSWQPRLLVICRKINWDWHAGKIYENQPTQKINSTARLVPY